MRNYRVIEQGMQDLANQRRFICEEVFPVGGIGVEIGVFLGQFSEIILEVTNPEKLYLVDPWNEDTSYPDTVNIGKRSKSQMDELAERVKEKFKEDERVKIIRSTSDLFFSNLKHGTKFDFIYVDGNHNYENVRADLSNAWKFLKPGGVIVVDSCNANAPYWGEPITQAVFDFCQEKSVLSDILPLDQCVIRKTAETKENDRKRQKLQKLRL